MEFSNEHGRITIYILVIIFFAMIVIMSKYLIVSNELEKERGLLDEIKKEYAVQNPEEKPEEKTDEKEPERDVFDGYEVKTDDIPVYNSDAFLFFSKYVDEKESPKYYIYQEDCVYIGGRNKDYTLMSDIFIDEDKDEFERKNKLIDKIDFNNHRINLKDGDYISK